MVKGLPALDGEALLDAATTAVAGKGPPLTNEMFAARFFSLSLSLFLGPGGWPAARGVPRTVSLAALLDSAGCLGLQI